jgi:hypothetical protein
LDASADSSHGASGGDVWFNNTTSKYRGNDSTGKFNFAKEGLSTGFIYWPNGPFRPNSNTLRTEGPITARDDSDTYDFIIPGDLDASLIVDGVNGIATSQFPATGDTFYNKRLLGDSSGVLADASDLIELGTDPALPTGYDRKLVLWPPALTTSGASWVATGYAVLGNSIRTYYITNEANSSVLIDGPAVVNTTVDISSHVPTGFRTLAHINVGFLNGVGSAANDRVLINIDETVTGGVNASIGPGLVITDKLRQNMDVITNVTASIKYNQTDNNTTGTNRTDIFVNGFTSPNRRD